MRPGRNRDLDPRVVKRLNELWLPIYPHMAGWMQRWLHTTRGKVLEIGPFSGGIGWALKERTSGLQAVSMVFGECMVPAVREPFPQPSPVVVGDAVRLPFQSVFDLIVVRGAFFFLTPLMIAEIHGKLAREGRALLGGGYGPLTPPDEIRKIAEESRSLNLRLGKKVLSREAVGRMASEAGVGACSSVIEEGGLWLLLSS